MLVAEPATAAAQEVADEDPAIIVWWATEIECVSAVARVERHGDLTAEGAHAALERLNALAERWHEVQPVEAVRRAARRLLLAHRLRAADALQVAAAIVASEGQPASLELVSLDEHLIDAARREGFSARRPT